MSKSMKTMFTLIIAFFVLLFIGAFFLFKIALSVETPVVQKDYFERGLNYNDTLAKVQNAEEAGWKMQVGGMKGGMAPLSGTIAVRITSPGEESIETSIVSLKIELPATIEGRKTYTLVPVEGEPGLFAADYTIDKKATYEVYLSALINGKYLLRHKESIYFY